MSRFVACLSTLFVGLFQTAYAANFGSRKCCCSTPVCVPTTVCAMPAPAPVPTNVYLPSACQPSVCVPAAASQVVSQTMTAEPSPLATGTPTRILRTFRIQKRMPDGSIVQEQVQRFENMTPSEELNFLRDEVQNAREIAGSDATVIERLRGRVGELRGEVYGGQANPPAESRIDVLEKNRSGSTDTN